MLVVGIGNSAMDIAVESSFVARKTFLSSRRGAYILPKYLFGRPLDQIGVNSLTGRLPWGFRQAILSTMYRVGVGKVQDYGLPEPDHKLGDAHPTISADFLNRIAHGEMTWKPNIARLDGDRVVFEDGSAEEIDIIVYCTGYKVTFPFFDEDFISAPDNDLPLFRRVFKPGIDNLAFIGLLQPLGAIMPLAEAQGRWLASYLRGEYRLPPLRRDGGRHPRRARADVPPLRRLQAPHDAGRLRQLPLRPGQGAQGRSGRARAAGFALPVAAAGSAPARRRPRDRRGGRSAASASRPRRTTAPRSSPPRARCSPSSATTRPGCAT